MGMSNARERTAFTEAVSEQVRAERAASGMSLDEVVAASGLSKMTYRRMESGERVADIAQLDRFCAAVGLPISTFLARAEERATGRPTPSPKEVGSEDVAALRGLPSRRNQR